MRARLLLLLPLALLGLAPSCWFSRLDPYQGWRGMSLAATGRFRVEQVDGVWWLVTPSGHPFFSAGVTGVRSFGDWAPDLGGYPYLDNVLARHGSAAAWAEVALARLRQAGVNTAGAWSENQWFAGRFPYTQFLEFSPGAPEVPNTGTQLAKPLRDFFDPSFEAAAVAIAEGARPCAEDAYCIGVFSDNELPWGPGLAQALAYVDAYMRLAAGAPGKLALQQFFEARYAGDVAAFNAAWNLALPGFDALQPLAALASNTAASRADRQAFRGVVAGRYFRVVHDALRAVDPALLILGARFLSYSLAPDVIAAAAPWVDVLSMNAYEWNETWFAIAQASAAVNGLYPFSALFDDLDAAYATAGRPILISEFGYRADDSGLPNSTPPIYPNWATQAERADAYERYLDGVLARPWIVGAHWFKHCDQPATGRNDGEDNNWGVVDIEDEPYPEIALRMWGVAVRMYEQRAALATP
jgi:hypothetical protein